MQKNIILFDLDGTLADTEIGVSRCVVYALEQFGITVDPATPMRRFIGPPLPVGFMTFCGFDEETAQKASAKFRERYEAVGWSECTPYDGIRELLGVLKAAGKTLMVATSKTEKYAVSILEHHGLSQYFDHICGSPPSAPASYGKADVIRDALTRAGVTDRTSAIMVGDRHHDIDGAREVGIDSLGILWGFGDRDELVAAGASAIAADTAEAQEILLDHHFSSNM